MENLALIVGGQVVLQTGIEFNEEDNDAVLLLGEDGTAGNDVNSSDEIDKSDSSDDE